jgi:D-alanyl-D-alanine carboxypeptidase (penicillin-binding protein 5/6)
MKITLQWLDPLPAPLVKGDVVGKLVLDLPGKSNSYELLVGESVEELGLFDRIGAALKYLIFGAGADVLANS